MMLCLMLLFFDSEAFKSGEESWRSERENEMKASESWLNLVGLFWLKEGANPFGSDQKLRISLPPHSTVAKAGTFYLEDGKVRYQMARGQRALLNDKPQNQGELGFDQKLTHNHMTIFLIERGGKLALRIRDLRAKKYVEFEKLDFYRPKEKYLVEGIYTPYDEPETLKVTTVISTEIDLIVPGIIRFDLNGKSLELLPTLESLEDEKFFIMFQDQTSGTTTYSGGRFLYAEKPKDGKIVLNFNRAINPPCGYTVYATCPLPPAQNWLEAPVEAGERIYARGHEL